MIYDLSVLAKWLIVLTRAKIFQFEPSQAMKVPSQAEPSWGTSMFDLKPLDYFCNKVVIIFKAMAALNLSTKNSNCGHKI